LSIARPPGAEAPPMNATYRTLLIVAVVLAWFVPTAHARWYDPTTGRWLQRDPIRYVNGANLYQYVVSNPLRHVDPEGLAAWDVDPKLVYKDLDADKRKDLRGKMKSCIVREVRKIFDKQQEEKKAGKPLSEGYDCADAAMTALARCAKENKVPLKMRYWDSSTGAWKWISHEDYNSLADYEAAIRQQLGTQNIVDNSKPQEWKDLEPGDLLLWDLSKQPNRDNQYWGHTASIEKKDKCGEQDCWKTIEGHLSKELSEGSYTQKEAEDKWKGDPGLKDGKGRYWDWPSILAPK
jgi:hypothetical protein